MGAGFALAITCRSTQRDVSAIAVKTAHDVQGSADIVALAVGKRVAQVAVDCDGCQLRIDVCNVVQEDAVDGRIHAGNAVGVAVEGGRRAFAAALAVAMAVGRTKRDFRQRVGAPLHTEGAIETVAA